ncbi:hypothetical protein [Maritalea porphyrae]|uniref:hypothetical protein n=1 Tax=Maritalea porphyrae TaxID=880732 RepID=UPI0022AEC4FE|nr:hypothetical protein [Maritalea porphyrae]MCZ4270926.1 hypothetical protein [Maritalea porphyrae]
MTTALETAFAKMEAAWAFKATLDQCCEADVIYTNAKILAETNKPSAGSFDQLAFNIQSGKTARYAKACKAMVKRRAEIFNQLKSSKAEAA